MLKLFRRAAPANDDLAPAVTPAEPANSALVLTIADNVSTLGRDAAEVRGALEDTQKIVTSQAEAFQALTVQVDEVDNSQKAISSATAQTTAAVAQARSALHDVSTEVGGIVETLKDVSSAAADITKIALQTRLVAFNASVEAKRAGEAGRGFGVVADAVKDLAAKVETSSKDIMRTIGQLDARIAVFSRELDAKSAAGESAIHDAFATVERDVTHITEAAASSQQTCTALNGRVEALATEIQQAMLGLDGAFACADRFLKMAENLSEVVVSSGADVPDRRYIEAAQEAARQLGQLLDDAVRTGTIAVDALFDEDYRPIPNTNPPQHTTRFVDIADRLFPQVQEKMLGLSDKVVFCIAADRNGYIATHNKQYCHPQRGDVTWNTANSRYRRIFNDRTGLGSAKNRRPFLLQTYRRDMGGGHFVLLKEASAPITVNGRHWGGVRLAFKF